MNDFSVTTVVVCDDVRREMTNKDILIGVYGSGITIRALPSQVGLCFWLEVVPKKVGKLSIEFRVDLPGKQPPVQIRVDAEVNQAGEAFAIFTPQLPYLISQAGELKIQTRAVGHEKWTLIKRVKFVYQPFPSMPN